MLGKLKLSGMDIVAVVVLIFLGLVFHDWYRNHPTDDQMSGMGVQGKGKEMGGAGMSGSVNN